MRVAVRLHDGLVVGAATRKAEHAEVEAHQTSAVAEFWVNRGISETKNVAADARRHGIAIRDPGDAVEATVAHVRLVLAEGRLRVEAGAELLFAGRHFGAGRPGVCRGFDSCANLSARRAAKQHTQRQKCSNARHLVNKQIRAALPLFRESAASCRQTNSFEFFAPSQSSRSEGEQ